LEDADSRGKPQCEKGTRFAAQGELMSIVYNLATVRLILSAAPDSFW